MNPRELTHTLGAVFLAIFICGVPATAADDDAVKDAQKLLDLVTRQVDTGSGSRTDVVLAQALLLEMKLRAKQLTRRRIVRMRWLTCA
jgi:outer membrane protein TolC